MGPEVQQRDGRTKPVLISANSFWNITNFRTSLIEALVGEGYPVRIVAPDPDLDWARDRRLEASDLAVDSSGLNPITDAALCLAYVHLFRRWKPRYFLGFTAKPNIYGCLAGRLSGVICLPNVTGLGTAFIGGGPLAWWVAWLYRLAFLHCPIVFFQNPDDRDLFLERRIVKPSQARLVPGSGIDLVRFTPAEPRAGEEQKRFLFIGRLLGDKGVREFAEAARQLRTEQCRWRFQLLGDLDPANRSGIVPGELRQWIEQGLVEHLGHAEDVRPHIAAATAVVLPSYREGLPRSLLEAAAMARPMIATDVPGNRQLVIHGVTGLRCEVRDPQSLAEAMRELGSMSAARRAQMGQEARALVEREFSVQRVIESYLEALTQLGQEARV